MSLTKISYSMIQGSPVNVIDFGADPTGVTDSTAAIQAAIDTGKTVWIPNGTYSITTLNLKQKYPRIVGESMVGTILKARSAITTMIDAYESNDGQVTPLFISNLTLDGNNIVTAACIRMRYRHMSNIENCYFVNATSTNSSGLFAVDCWLTSVNNCRFTQCFDGLNFYGSNHRSSVNSSSFTGCTNSGITCKSLGTALDGNSALVFNNCDVEFGSGNGIYLNVSDAAFYGCYVGENINLASFFVDAGTILINGGIVFFGHTVNSFAVTGNGGTVLFEKCQINGQTNNGIFYLMSGGLKNYYKWQNCNFSITTGGDPTISGDRLDYGPPSIVFAQRLGKNYSASLNDVAATNAVVPNNGRRLTCNGVVGVNPVMSLNCALINPSEKMDGENLYLVLVYKANTVGTLQVRLSGSPLGGAPTFTIGIPSNSASIATYLKFDVSMPTGSYSVFEFLAIGCAITDYIEIQECFFADNRMLQKISGQTVITNLYKC